MFSFIQERVYQKTSGWKGKLLSAAGKETLIKAVASAVPNHAMTCFKLQKKLCQDLNAIVARFWWGQKNDERRIHWVNWEKLSKSKSKGRMGFKNMLHFNSALLGKTAWRVFNDDNSLLFQTLKGRYFPNCSLDAWVGYNPSWGWRSLMEGRNLLEKGLRRKIGNGFQTHIWNDPWILSSFPRFSLFLLRLYRLMLLWLLI